MKPFTQAADVLDKELADKIDGIISAIGTDNAIRARKEIERANGKIV